MNAPVLPPPLQRRRCLLLGLSPLGVELAGEIQRRPGLGIELVGYVTENGRPPAPNGALPCVGSIGELDACVARTAADIAVVALQRRRYLPVESLLRLRIAGLKVVEAQSLYEMVSGKIPLENLNPSWLVSSEGFRLNPWTLRVQRVVSFLLAALGLLAALPFFLLIALAIRLDSSGPALFRQQRVGRAGRRFTLFKFRSMRADAERATGPVWAREQDDRVTRVGRLLRLSRLDELPQLWNVLRGEMSLVGPRPERPEFVEFLAEQVPYYNLRHCVRPGISGWAQVMYRYGATVEEQKEKLRYDLFYIKHFSLRLDLLILFKTVKVVLALRGAR